MTGWFRVRVHLKLLRIGGGSQPAECLLRSLLVVFPSPAFGLGACVQQPVKPVLVDAFVAQAAIERFDVGALFGLPGSIRRNCTPRPSARRSITRVTPMSEITRSISMTTAPWVGFQVALSKMNSMDLLIEAFDVLAVLDQSV